MNIFLIVNQNAFMCSKFLYIVFCLCLPSYICFKVDILIYAAQMSNPYSKNSMYRNPRYENAGNFMRLSDFLAFSKGKDLSGIMITIEVRSKEQIDALHSQTHIVKIGYDSSEKLYDFILPSTNNSHLCSLLFVLRTSLNFYSMQHSWQKDLDLMW